MRAPHEVSCCCRGNDLPSRFNLRVKKSANCFAQTSGSRIALFLSSQPRWQCRRPNRCLRWADRQGCQHRPGRPAELLSNHSYSDRRDQLTLLGGRWRAVRNQFERRHGRRRVPPLLAFGVTAPLGEEAHSGGRRVSRHFLTPQAMPASRQPPSSRLPERQRDPSPEQRR